MTDCSFDDDEDDIGTLMAKNAAKSSFEQDYCSGSSSDDGDDDEDDALGTSRRFSSRNNRTSLSTLDSDDDEPVCSKFEKKPVATLESDDDSDDDEIRVVYAPTPQTKADPTLQKLRAARQHLDRCKMDKTKQIELMAEAMIVSKAKRKLTYTITATVNGSTKMLSMQASPEETQAYQVIAWMMGVLQLKESQTTIALRSRDGRLLGNFERLASLQDANLKADIMSTQSSACKYSASTKKRRRVSNSLKLVVRLHEEKHEMLLGPDEPFSVLLDEFFAKHGVRVRLFFDGDILQRNQTPKELDMENDDLIDAKVIT